MISALEATSQRQSSHTIIRASSAPDAVTRAVQNYAHVLECVQRMKLLEADVTTGDASDYWSEELEGFDYMLDATPRILAKLRQHTYHLTGLRFYDYRSSQTAGAELFRQKLDTLSQLEGTALLVPESPELGGYGHRLDAGMFNVDTLKFFEALIAMKRGRALEPLMNASADDRPMVIEIGGGWGGLAYQVRTLYPQARYTVVDFPEVFLFSAVYLLSMFPGCTAAMIETHGELDEIWDAVDFVFIPAALFPAVDIPAFDLAINTVSFQEMTSEQVDAYAARLAERGCRLLYSLNRDRSPHNSQLSEVSEILARHFSLEEVHVLDLPYNEFRPREAPKPDWKQKLLGRAAAQPQRSVYEYRHLVGRR